MQHRIFGTDAAATTALQAWWATLENNKGDRAALARAHSPSEVVTTSAYQKAWFGHFVKAAPGLDKEALPMVLGLLARVRETDQRGLGKMFAQGKGDSSKGLSQLRFRRLLQINEAADMYTGLRRAVDVVGKRAPLSELAELAYHWAKIDALESFASPSSKQQQYLDSLYKTRDQLRTELAYEYFEFYKD